MTRKQICDWARRTFKCDQVRLTEPCGTFFMLLGWKRNTKIEREAGRTDGQWYRNGVAYDFNYVHETCIASGKTLPELKASAMEYKRLTKINGPLTVPILLDYYKRKNKLKGRTP